MAARLLEATKTISNPSQFGGLTCAEPGASSSVSTASWAGALLACWDPALFLRFPSFSLGTFPVGPINRVPALRLPGELGCVGNSQVPAHLRAVLEPDFFFFPAEIFHQSSWGWGPLLPRLLSLLLRAGPVPQELALLPCAQVTPVPENTQAQLVVPGLERSQPGLGFLQRKKCWWRCSLS